MRIGRKLTLGLLVAFVVGMTAVASAPAVEPPLWTKGDAELSGERSISGSGSISRLWVTQLSIAIVCKKNSITGKIKNEASAGKGSAAVTYQECTVWNTEKNPTTMQFYQDHELEKCAVQDSVLKASGTIAIPEMKTFLAFVAGHAPSESAPISLVEGFEPKTGKTLVTAEITNRGAETCAQKATAELTGGVLARIPRFAEFAKEEAVMGDLLLETTNPGENKAGEENVLPQYPKYKLTNAGASTEDVLKFGTDLAALESTEQVELTQNTSTP
jgi:hypothetical protein